MAQAKWEGAVAALDSMIPNFRFFGASFWVAWQLVLFGCEINFCGFSLGSREVAAVYVVVNLSFACTLAVVGALHRSVFRLLGRPTFMVAMGLVTSVGTMLIFLLQAFGSGWGLVGAVACGIGSSFLACRSIQQFAELGSREVVFMAAMVQVAAFALDYTVLSITTVVQPWLFFALPTLGALCMLVEPADKRASAPAGGRETPRWFWRFTVGILFFAIPVSICRACFPIFGDENAALVDYRRLSGVLIIAIMLILAFVALRLPKKARYGLLMYRLILVSSVLYVVFGVLGPQSGAVLSLSGAVNALINLCVWALLARIAFKSGASTLRIFAFGYGSFTIGGIAGWAVGLAAEMLSLSLDAVLVCLVVSTVVTLVVALFLFRQEDLVHMMQPVEDEEDSAELEANTLARKALLGVEHGPEDKAAAGTTEDANGGAEAWQYSRLLLAQRAQLSARELDVLDLISRGYSARMVSDELFISYNTARNHIQRIYAKLNIHSRDELHLLVKELQRPPLG